MADTKENKFKGCSNCGNMVKGKCSKGYVCNPFRTSCPDAKDWIMRVKKRKPGNY